MRLDFVFSYWIFAWYLCYVFKLTNYNPKVALLLGLIENGVIGLWMFYHHSPLLPYFLGVNTIIKLIPYLSIQRTMQWIDLGYTVGLFVVYLIWLKLNGQSYDNLKKSVHFPVSTWLQRILL